MIYIQSQKYDDLEIPYNHESACAMFGTIDTKQKFELLDYNGLLTGDFDFLIKDNLFVGTVEFMNEVFRRIGLYNVRLPLNSNRYSEIKTLGEAYEIAKTKEIFIKPMKLKQFTGLVLDGSRYSCLDDLPLNSQVYIYEPISNIVSEWRAYIHNDKLEDLRNYSGDIDKFPNMYDLKLLIVNNRLKRVLPKTYCIDIAILKSSLNTVIEYNDMWAIGNYGVPNDIYLNMLKSRYFDIVKNYNK